MSEANRLLDQMRRTYAGDAWHGDPVRAVLHRVTAEAAEARPVEAAHTIWEIVNHLIAWKTVTADALDGMPIPDPLSDDLDWPPVTAVSDEDWAATLRRLDDAEERLEARVAGLDDAALDATVPGRDYSVAVLLHGAIHHDLYHVGQAMVLHRAATT